MPRTGLSPALIARLSKRVDHHKYDHGHALILSGGPGRGGAARLAARAALRVGAGLVTLACPPEALAENAAQLTAIMLRPLEGSAGLEEVLEDPRLNAICMGPGLGIATVSRNHVRVALATRRPVVLDADALTSFADDPRAFIALLHPNAVLTPHMGEFARVFPDLARALEADPRESRLEVRRAAVTQAAARCGATVLLKGQVTLIADPTGHLAELHLTGKAAAPWLATAGSGDVLAGLVTGLLARGFSPFQAAETAAWLHGAAGRHLGAGLIAEDLPEALPAIFAQLGV
ncbi:MULTISPECIES: NAD(P)H-hydrate dehydratase [unclassified Meridianimarinicoccus]|uniref:NAD(P)H-hydrate dehydratase n=1 Tax=unclassified Meridianimarinicoccus TaxID=2923344 RepID=UPI001867C2EF|nr:NAD(P)H-hydrate dehydratase [Fluviibacterium sp. MJW13]